MSRWVFDRADGTMSVAPWQAYAKLNTGRAAAWVPQGSWSYAPRHIRRTKEYTRERPLVAFRDNLLVGCLQGMKSTFRRDFKLEQGELFPENLMENSEWVVDGKLTDAGMDMLRKRMPHVDFSAFDSDRDVNHVSELFTVKSIVDFVERKLAVPA